MSLDTDPVRKTTRRFFRKYMRFWTRVQEYGTELLYFKISLNDIWKGPDSPSPGSLRVFDDSLYFLLMTGNMDVNCFGIRRLLIRTDVC